MVTIMNDTQSKTDALGGWPTGDALPLLFISNVHTWRYKGSPWDGTQVEETDKGHYAASVLDYVDRETWHVGWVGNTWAEAFAAIGAALDVDSITFLERELAETQEKRKALQAEENAQNADEIHLLEEHEAAVSKRISMEREGL